MHLFFQHRDIKACTRAFYSAQRRSLHANAIYAWPCNILLLYSIPSRTQANVDNAYSTGGSQTFAEIDTPERSRLTSNYAVPSWLALLLSTLAMNLGKCLLGFGLGRYKIAQPPSAAGPCQAREACEPAELRNPKTELGSESRNSKRRARLAETISQNADYFLANVSL